MFPVNVQGIKCLQLDSLRRPLPTVCLMIRLGIHARSFISNFRLIINVMSSQALRLQDCLLKQYETGTKKESVLETASSNCVESDHKKTVDGSQGDKSTEKVLLWHELSYDEKRIYFAHQHAVMNDENTYIDPCSGYMVFTEEFLKKRKTCCGNGCRHCPYKQENVPEGKRKKFNSAFYI